LPKISPTLTHRLTEAFDIIDEDVEDQIADLKNQIADLKKQLAKAGR
jgi:hypothetical protein